MKKFLSLVLALVMTASLVTVSAGAKEFKDDKDVTYDEAVAVISEIGVVDGDTDGNFRPTDNLSRGAAAKIICNLILGPTTAAELKADTAPYKDVPVSNTFSGYIAYCAKEGIISGYADGSFRPAGTLTGYAFMKMLLGALGYDGSYEGYTGANWSINVAKQAIGIGLNKGLTDEFNGVDFVTREEAALYSFNTLKATMVDYDQKITTNVNGVDVTISQGSAKPVDWTEGKNNDRNIKEDGFVQFAEEYFPKLVRNDDYTKFMEPANVWTYDKTEIGTYERKDLIVETYTTGVSGKDVYDLLKSGVIKDNELESYVDGVNGTVKRELLVRSNNKDLPGTGNGVVTKVYLNTDKDLITVVSINTYLAKATADYNEKTEYAPLNVYVDDANGKNINVDVEDVAAVVDVKEDTFYQVQLSYKDDDVEGDVVTLKDVELLEDSTVTKFSADKGAVTKLTVGGEEYKANVKAFYDDEVLNEYDKDLLTNNTYNVYVDANGYFIGVDLFEGTNNYVFITGYDLDGSNIAVKTATAAAIFTDGTMKTIKVNVSDTNENIETALNDAGKAAGKAYFDQWNSAANDGKNAENNWYTYTVTDEVYTLKPADRSTKSSVADGSTIRTDSLYVDDSNHTVRVYGEDATIFLTADTGAVSKPDNSSIGITDVTGMYTGVQSVEVEMESKDSVAMGGNVFTVYDSDHYMIAAVVLGDAIGSNDNLAYILSEAKYEEYKDGVYYWQFEAIMDGKVQTFEAKSNYPNDKNLLTTYKNNVLELRFDGEYVTDLKKVDDKDIYTKDDMRNPIDGQSVYFMKGLAPSDHVVNFSGNTLYITKDQKDVALAMGKDAKAVVIQVENGETVKREFSSVASAVKYLPDAGSDDGKQYKGDIFAVLNSNTSAAWIVFNSETPVNAGNVPTPDDSDFTPVVTQNGTFLDIKAHTTVADGSETYTAAWNWLVNNGYSVINATKNPGTGWTFIASKNGNSTFFTTRLITMIKLYVNNVEKFVEADGSKTWGDVLAGKYFISDTSKITTVGVASANDLAAVAATKITVADFSLQDGRYYKDGMYKVTVNSTDKYYQVGETIALTGSHYTTTGGTGANVTNAPIPSSGLKMTTGLDGKTITTAWKVDVSGKAVQYVTADGSSSTSSLGLAEAWYRTDDGKFVKTTVGSEFANVAHDIVISNTTPYHKVSTVNEQTSANKVGSSSAMYTYTIATTGVKEGSSAIYVKAGDTITVTVNYVSGAIGSSKTDTVTVACTNATLSPVGGACNFTDTSVAATKTQTVEANTFTTDGALTITGTNA